MTRSQLIAILFRRWYVLVAVLMCTVIAIILAGRAQSVYYTEVDVVFLPPADAVSSNALEGRQESLIHFAAIMERDYNGGEVAPRLSSSTATLYGAGVRQGQSVLLPNVGGQWQISFDRPVLAVEVVDSSQERVLAKLRDVLQRLDSLVVEQQQKSGVAAARYIKTELAPKAAVVQKISGSPIRATIGLLILGLCLSISAAVLVDQRQLSTKRRGPAGSARQ